MTLDKKDVVRLVAGFLGISVLSMVCVIAQSTKDALYTAHLLAMTGYLIVYMALYKVEQKREEREKAGLRGSWKDADIDELEERVRKLEERN